MMARRLRGDDGASLILALVFMSLMGIFVASALSLGAVSFENTTVTRSRAKQLYAADGGVEYAIQQLHADVDLCPEESPVPTELGTTTLNGREVTLTCQTTDGGTSTTGGSPLLSGYVAVFGSGGVEVDGGSGDNTGGWGRAAVHGDAYSGGPMSVSWDYDEYCPGFGPYLIGPSMPAPDVCAWIDVVGDLELGSSSGQSCTPDYVYPTSCAVAPSTPEVNAPPVWIPPTTAPSMRQDGRSNCWVLYPGRYTSPPSFSSERNYYLASGTYYFASGDLNLRGTTIFGGAPSPGTPWEDTPQLNDAMPCTNDRRAEELRSTQYDADTAGTGVTIIKGGSGKLRVQEASKIELYTRVPAPGSVDAATTPGVTFWANTSATGTTGGPYTGVPNNCGAAGCEVFLTTEKLADVVIHGLAYLQNSRATLAEPYNTEVGDTPGTVSFFLGGIWAKKLTVTRTAELVVQEVALAGTGESITTTEPRTTIVTATAQSTSGGAPTTVTAVIKPDEASGPVIETWRQT